LLDPVFWNDPDFDNVEDGNLLLVYAYLISNEAATCTGAYRLSMRKLVNECRKDAKTIASALKALEGKPPLDKIMFEKGGQWVWVKGTFSRQFPKLPHRNMIKSVVKELTRLRESDFPFMKEFDEKHGDLILRFEKAFKGLPNGNGSPHKKEKEKGNIYTREFEEFWSIYPRKLDKFAAYKSWNIVVERGEDVGAVIAGVARYATFVAGRDEAHIKHGSTWLNNRCWENEYKPEKGQQTGFGRE